MPKTKIIKGVMRAPPPTPVSPIEKPTIKPTRIASEINSSFPHTIKMTLNECLACQSGMKAAGLGTHRAHAYHSINVYRMSTVFIIIDYKRIVD
jgi:hypothetical protein